MTARMLAAMDNPHLTIIGHPTGRLLLSRDPYGLDLDAVIEKAARPASRSRSTPTRTGSISTGGSCRRAREPAWRSRSAPTPTASAGLGQRGLRRRHRPGRAGSGAATSSTRSAAGRVPGLAPGGDDRVKREPRRPARKAARNARSSSASPRTYPDAQCALDYRQCVRAALRHDSLRAVHRRAGQSRHAPRSSPVSPTP